MPTHPNELPILHMSQLPWVSGRQWRGGQFAASTGGGGGGAVAASPLLDDFGSAAIAYSLRHLRTEFSGNCIRVRRASDDTELDIGFAGGALDTSALGSHCSGTDGFVVEWYDQSGNANDASQPTATYQPKIVSSGTTLTQNGKPAIDFDGVDNYLKCDTNTFSGGGLESSDMSCFAVATLDELPDAGSPTAMHLIGTGSTGSGGATPYAYGDKISVFYYGPASYWKRIATWGGGGQIITGSAAVADTQYLMAFTGAYGGTFSLSINGGTADTTTGARNSSNYTSQGIGAGLGSGTTPQDEWDGTIQEIVQWQADQESNRTDIVSNINAFYSVF